MSVSATIKRRVAIDGSLRGWAARGAKNRSADGVSSGVVVLPHRLQCDQSFVCDGAQAEVLPQAIDQCQPQRQPEEQPAAAGLGEVALRAHLLCTNGVRWAALWALLPV